MSNRNNILEALKTTLTNITIDNGFENTVLEVERKFIYVDNVKSFPKLMVLGGDEELDDQLGEYTVSTFSIRIIGYIKDKMDPEVSLCSLLSDVLRVLENGTYNPNKLKMRPIKVETDEGILHDSGDGFAMFILTVEVIYRWDREYP